MTCPCGSEQVIDHCCGRFHAGDVPSTPEQVMRSRYSAFATGNAEYLRATWHPGTCPDEVGVDSETQWLGLTIIDAPAVEAGATRGVVEFEARFDDGDGPGSIHERSRFVWQSGRWWYLDGVHS